MQVEIKAFDYVTSLNSGSAIRFEPRIYSPYLVNRSMSYSKDSVLQVNEMNQRPNTPPEWQYRFLQKLISKNPRRNTKWEKAKGEFSEGLINHIKRKFSIGSREAKLIISNLSSDQLAEYNDQLNE